MVVAVIALLLTTWLLSAWPSRKPPERAELERKLRRPGDPGGGSGDSPFG